MNDYYNEGFSAFTEAEDFSDNPYPVGVTRNQEWADGWTAAQEELGDEETEDLEQLYKDWVK